jgi:NADPH-dependent 2,4-dienoyl-CoA reductase/sulfur reductase-like enzyme/rhodanese-related sulfurtransferase
MTGSLKIVIVGGVAGGMSAAARARRMNEQASITVLERGGFISFANCGLPYYLAGRIAEEDKLLVTTPERARARFNVDARVGHEVTAIDRAARQVQVLERATGRSYPLDYDKLILAPGASPIVPGIANVNAVNVQLLRSMEDTRAVHRRLAVLPGGASAVIVGAGFIGLEMAEALRERGLRVTLVEKAPHVLPPLDFEIAAAVADELRAHEVTVITGDGLKALHANSAGLVTAVETESGRRIAANLVLLSIGVRPNVALATAASLKLGPSGAIAVDEYQRTSDPDVYAVGDAAEVVHGVTGRAARIPLAGPANRQGRLAGEHAATGSAPRPGRPLGTAIVQVFDLAVGLTGLTERAAKDAGLATADAAHVLPGHHAGYYPGAQPLRIKLVYDKASGKVLGAQVAGKGGVDKRLDVIATAIHFGATVDDLAGLDLAYAPQFASAKDPVHMAAMVAQNQRRELVATVAWQDLRGDELLLDVRTAAEFARGSLPGAINIPVDELRARLAELDRRQPIVIYCQIGLRGYIAQRILRQNGFENVRNLKGGLSLALLSGAKLAAVAA